MARSVGEAAAEGLERGLRIGTGLREQARSEERQRRQEQQQDEDRAYLIGERDRQRKRQEDDDALRALDQQYEDLRLEGEGYAQQYGPNVPPEVSAGYQQRVGEVSSTRSALLRKRYEPIVKQRQQQLADIASRLQAGQLNLDDVPDADLYRAMVTAARRDPADLMGRDGQPSRVAQSVTDIMTGLETKNEGLLLRGANVLLEPELKVGVGETSPHGGRIIGKELVKLIPHPQDPNRFMPVVKVYVRKGKIDTAGEAARADRIQAEGGPPGATGYYLAPITENRSSDPDDPPRAIDLSKAMDYAGNMQTLAMLMDQPQIRAKLERGAAEASKDPDNFLEAFYRVKGRMPAKPVEYKSVPRGGMLAAFDTRTGQPTGQTIEGPPIESNGSGLAAQIQAVQDYAAEQGISEAEAAITLQQRGLLRPPKGAGKGGGAPAAAPRAPSDLTGEEFLKTLPADEQRIVKGLVDGTIKQESISTKGNRREILLAKAKQYQAGADLSGKKGREVPTAAQNAMLENVRNLERAERALRLVGGLPLREGETADMDATGLKGYLPNQVLNRLDPKGVDARAAIAELGSLIIHDRSGAAVTAAEFPRLAPFIPTEKDDAGAVQKKLRAFVRIYKEEQEALESAYGEDNGFKPFKVTRPGDAGAAPGGAPAAQDKPAGGAASPPIDKLKEGVVTTFRNGQRWTLRGGQPVQVQ